MPSLKQAQTSPASLRALALAASSGFRSKIVEVPEWNGAKVMLREPSGEAWVKFREIMMPPETEDGQEPQKLSIQDEYLRNKLADVVMFIDVLMDESGNRVFSESDEQTVSEIYGPVHSRLLSQAIGLGMSQEKAEVK
ncbi:phage tail assembly chaperone [Pantoea sp. GD03673]|uniref:phage tail assembly chaperone n=1 Tax=Pantoea sp. GD03673 TaxID=2975364 RepID=UPI002447ECEC|nr:phage tail assembly chaperone [Pantoea sp. GD03673]MDH2066888.1 phage tail assembly chaperone [Pantoea sp. GD03673]